MSAVVGAIRQTARDAGRTKASVYLIRWIWELHALGSAVSVASMNHVDNRIMFSVGKGALSLGMLGPEVKMILGIPLAAAGKAPYFDRK